MSRYQNVGQSLIGGIQAGQQIRAGYESKKSSDAIKEASTAYFERLRSLGAEEVDTGAAIPVPGAGSENMAAVQGAVQGGNGPAAIPSAIPTDGSSVQPKPKKKYRSVTADDYRELDTMAAKLATLAGDPKAYEAYRGMARSYTQGRIMDNMRRAQVALQVGDQEGLEDAIQSAYRFVPDGQELKLKRDKDGNLMFKHPQSGEDLPVNAQSLRLFSMAALDPDAMEETMYGRAKDNRGEKRADRGLDIQDRQAGTSERNAATAEAALEETKRSNKADEKLKADNAQSERTLRNAQAVQALSYAQYLDNNKGKTGANGALKPDDARKYAEAVNDVARQYIMPMQKQEVVDGLGNKTYELVPAPRLPGFENADEATVNKLSSYAEQIGIANPHLGISHAVGAASVIYKALQGQGDVDVDPNTNSLRILVDGKVQQFRVPPEMIQTLVMQSQQAPPPAQGIPTR